MSEGLLLYEFFPFFRGAGGEGRGVFFCEQV